MGQPELGKDPRYVDHVSRGKNQIELDHRINEWTKTLTVEELEALMIEYSIPAGKMYRAPEMLADPHFAARNSIIDVETERWGTLKMQNAFPKLSDTPSRVRAPAPSEVGQHNAEIYGGAVGNGRKRDCCVEGGGRHLMDDIEANYAGAFDGHLAFGKRPALLIVDLVMAYLDPSSPLYAGVESALASNERLVATGARTRASP